MVINKKGLIEYFGKPAGYELEKCLPIILQEEEVAVNNYYDNVNVPETFLKERDEFLNFFSRLLSTYADTLNSFIEYQFEFSERTWVTFKHIKSYTTNVFVYTVKERESDVHYLMGLFQEYSNGWNMLNTRVVIKETFRVEKGTECDNCGEALHRSQFICLECAEEKERANEK